MRKPLLVMLAGSNGAGRSTFYEAFLSQLGLPFLNADRLALDTGLGGYAAADVVGEMRRSMIEKTRSFVTETVFSDPVGAKVRQLEEAVSGGFDVQLIFIGFESPYRLVAEFEDGVPVAPRKGNIPGWALRFFQ